MFKVGQKVICKEYGDGVVTATSDACEDYPIEVRFADGHYESYTLEGKLFENTQETHLTPREGENMPKDFYVGQKVWCALFGEGVVAEITHGLYPVKVMFKNGDVTAYTSRGHMYSYSINQSLFQHPVKIVLDESATKPSIDWSHVHGKYNYLATDDMGNAWLYGKEPTIDDDNGCWDVELSEFALADTHVSYAPGTCDWKESLVKRPEGDNHGG